MYPELSAPTYSYVRGGSAIVSATFRVLAFPGGPTLAETQVSCQASLDLPQFGDTVATSLAAQGQEFFDTFVAVATRMQQLFPTCQNFDAAAQSIISLAQAKLTNVTQGA